MASALIARSLIVVFGLLYPAYNSYKAIKTRDKQAYVKWMIYWIVFAVFYNIETITDLVLSWLPLYYELKVIFVLWLLSPQTQGSDVLYRVYIHPHLTKHEERYHGGVRQKNSCRWCLGSWQKELDKVWDKFKDQSYSALVKVGVHGVNLALQGAIKGQTALAEQLNKVQAGDVGADNSDSVDFMDGEEFFEETTVETYNTPVEPVRGPGGRTLSRTQSLLSHRHDKPQPYQRRHGTDSSLYSSDIGYTLRRSRPSDPAFHTAEDQRESGILRRPFSQSSLSSQDRDSSPSVRKRYSSPVDSSLPSRPVLRFEPEETRASRARSNNQRKSPTDNLSQHTQKVQSTTHKQSSHSRRQPTDSQSKSSRSLDTKSSKSQKRKSTETKSSTEQEEANPNDNPVTEKPKTTEEKLLYKTKKISDIKHHKIKSPFLTMW